MATDVTYPPLDTPKAAAPGVWIVDSGPLRVLGLVPIPIRMTILRLADGTLLLHSPTRFSAALWAEVEVLGPIGHLVAPNSAHWMWVADWHRRVPGAVTWAAPGLRARPQVRRSGVRLDHDLGDARPPPPWPAEIETVAVPGAGGFCEVALHHAESGTLVLTDLIDNLEPAKLPALARPFAKLLGATAPDGRAPAYLRAVVKAGGAPAREAARRLVALRPRRVIFAHGRWFDTDAAARLERSLRWLA